jgi:hypothetical protein
MLTLEADKSEGRRRVRSPWSVVWLSKNRTTDYGPRVGLHRAGLMLVGSEEAAKSWVLRDTLV